MRLARHFVVAALAPWLWAQTGPDHERVRAELRAAIAEEMARCALPGVVIALADGPDVVWSAGLGVEDPVGKRPLRGNSPVRVASISKAFTATAILRAVERGGLDLDEDVESIAPGVRPRGFAGQPVTLRRLLTHTAGVLREPPLGHYFDLVPRPLDAVARSLAQTALVSAPGSTFKYSNAGFAWAGHVLATRADARFEDVVRRDVLGPLGLDGASFSAGDLDHVAQGVMWTYDGRAIPTPRVDLGLGPAANLCASMQDLVRFAQTWFLGEHRVPHALLQEATLRTMFQGQGGIGLGCFADRFAGHLRVGHDGAYYGVASHVAALPEVGLAVAVATTVDFAAGPVQRLLDRAFTCLLAAREGEEPPPRPALVPIARDRARVLAGTYAALVLDPGTRAEVAAGERLELLAHGDVLWLREREDLWQALASDGSGMRLIAADRGTAWRELQVDGGVLVHRGLRFARVPHVPPPACPAEFQPFLGEYGPDHDVLLVFERDGHLCVLIEWLAEYPLQPVDTRAGRFLLERGLYGGEGVQFERDERGGVTAVVVGAVRFARRPLLGVDGGSFRIEPRFPKERLLEMARQARAPRPEPGARAFDLVELAELDPTIRYDVRYAGADNFMGFPVYERAEAKLQRPAAEALVRVHRALAAHGLGLTVHDAYRPWLVTKMFFDATPDAQRHFVADPSRGSRHNRGCAVDLTLHDLATGEAVAMPSLYDEFTPRAYPSYPGGTSRQRWYRELLRAAMEAEGFAVYEFEWWHFDYRDWQSYPVR